MHRVIYHNLGCTNSTPLITLFLIYTIHIYSTFIYIYIILLHIVWGYIYISQYIIKLVVSSNVPIHSNVFYTFVHKLTLNNCILCQYDDMALFTLAVLNTWTVSDMTMMDVKIKEIIDKGFFGDKLILFVLSS